MLTGRDYQPFNYYGSETATKVIVAMGSVCSTIKEVVDYLVNEKKEVVGRPTMTACIDGYSSMCLGYSLGFYGGVKSLRDLVKNICCYKVDCVRSLILR